MSRSNGFRPGAFAVLRLAGAPPAAAVPTRTAPDPATSSDSQLTGYLRAVLAEHQLLEAIELSSPSLADSLRRVLEGDNLNRTKLERAVLATSRYLLRMTGRPTPFGLLAGVAPVEFGQTAQVRIGSEHTRDVLPDAGWLHTNQRQRLPERVVANNLVAVSGDRLVLPYLRKLAAEEPGRQLSIAHTPAVRLLRETARRPTAYGVLRERLLAEHPDASVEDADHVLRQLLDREILLGEYAEVTENPTVQVDLRIDAEVRLSRTVAEEAARAAEVLWRLSPQGDGLPSLGSYHRAFLDRYGTDRVVAVLELLDPHLGLGPPAGYRVPRGERSGAEIPDNVYPAARDQLLAGELGKDELVLDDDLVDRLAGESGDRPPDSLDLCAQLFADSADAVDRGDFLLAATSGSIAAGAMIGRFARLLGLEEALGELLARPGPLPVQLEFEPFEPRFGNVLRAPRVLPHSLAVGTFADPDDPGVIDVRDVFVGSTGERLYLLSAKLGRELTVVRPNMLNVTTGAPNVARFLAAVGLAGRRFWTPWQWGRLEVLPRLPRVRSARSILAPALWRTDPVLASAKGSTWELALDRWRDRLQVPDVVRVGMFDHYLDLDLRSRLHRRILREQLRRQPSSVVSETPAAYGIGLGLTGGRANELVVPILSTAKREEVAPNPSWRTACSRPIRYLPGGEWLSAKIYLIADLQDALLVGHVGRLVEQMGAERWFFLRYRDPDAHLRLRFHQGDAAVLHEWAGELVKAGLIRTLVLDEYEPEIARYGGLEVIAAAEQVFCADSQAVLEQLRLRADGRLQLPMESLTALNHLDLLSAFGQPDQWFVDTYPIELSNEVSPSVRAEFGRLLDRFEPLDCWLPRAGAVRNYAGVSDQAVMSVLHLHSNRLLGTDRAAERRAYGLLRTVLRQRTDRRRHGR